MFLGLEPWFSVGNRGGETESGKQRYISIEGNKGAAASPQKNWALGSWVTKANDVGSGPEALWL